MAGIPGGGCGERGLVTAQHSCHSEKEEESGSVRLPMASGLQTVFPRSGF